MKCGWMQVQGNNYKKIWDFIELVTQAQEYEFRFRGVQAYRRFDVIQAELCVNIRRRWSVESDKLLGEKEIAIVEMKRMLVSISTQYYHCPTQLSCYNRCSFANAMHV